MNDQRIAREYGYAELTPSDDVVVGTYQTWAITYTAGRLGMDDGSRLKIASNMTSDWGPPQFSQPSADHYCSVKTTGEATVEARFEQMGGIRPWKHTITVDIFDGGLGAGDTVTVLLGDTSGGSLGIRVQTFPEKNYRFAVMVDAFGTGDAIILPDELQFDVLPGRARRLRAVVPSDARPGEEVKVSVRAEDYWGNTATGYDESVTVRRTEGADAVLDEITLTEGIGHGTVSVEEEGVYRFRVEDQERGLVTTTNPVNCSTDSCPRLYWGDIHGQSGETVGTGTITEYFDYARDNAFLDYTSHAGNDFQITDEFWQEIQDHIQDYHEPGAFVTFLCYEWSANTPQGGDHNVYFLDDEAPIHRSSSWQIADGLEKHEGLHPVEELYEFYAGRDDVLIIPHQGGRPARLEVFDQDLSPFVEIASIWGVFEWFGQEALEKGYHVGFVGGSDDHSGRMGATYPDNLRKHLMKGAMMATQAEELTREALWDAFKARRCYATTGARIRLDVTVAGEKMGGRVATDDCPRVEVDVNGTAPISRIELFRGSQRIGIRDLTEGDDWIEIRWAGDRSRIRDKVQVWDGGLSVNGGNILAAEPFGFFHPERGIEQVSDTSVRWTSRSAGNHQGVRLKVDASPDARFSFSTEPLSDEFMFADLDGERRVQREEGDGRAQVVYHRTGLPISVDASAVFTPDCSESGTFAYYVRVHQEDGEMAWSSPVQVEQG